MSGEGYRRRIQLTGSSTLIVSLPKDWVRLAGLHKGSFIRLIPRHGLSLLLIPEREEDLKEIVLRVDEKMGSEKIVRELISTYQAGFDVIKVSFKSPRPEAKAAVKDTVRRRLMGMEVLSESASEILIQCFTRHMEFPLQDALRRAEEIASSMLEDAVEALLGKNHQLAAEVFQRDDEVDRLFHYMIRQLNTALEKPGALEDLGLMNPIEFLSYASIAKAIERVGDHAVSIALIAEEINGKLIDNLAAEITNMNREAVKAFKSALNSIEKKDGELANSIVDGVEEMRRKQYERAVEKVMKWGTSPRKASLIKTVLEDLMRVAEYSADIAEQAILLSIIVAETESPLKK